MSDEFRTKVKIGKYEDLIDVGSKVLLVGSCFTDNMGAKFKEFRMNALVNPFGVVYNPVSIARLLNRVLLLDYCDEDELVFHNGLWHHLDFHGRFSDREKQNVCENIDSTLVEVSQYLKKAEFLILTFGTAFVYEYDGTSLIVSNCHKMPDSFFYRYRLDPEEIVEDYQDLIVDLRAFNPSLKIIFTISPVRHLKDGAHGNQVSKSSLMLAVDKLCGMFEKVFYFPAYEIVMDDLRDYRFYDEGLINPSRQTIRYIWERFSEVLLSDRAHLYTKKIAKLEKAVNHRIQDAGNEEAVRNFALKNLQFIDSISSDFPEVNLIEERNYFTTLLKE